MLMEETVLELFVFLMENEPEAKAEIRGNEKYPALKGTALFYPFWSGALVLVRAAGLPSYDEPCQGKWCALHIHEGGRCSGTKENPFADAGMHFNPLNCQHPEHAGDLPLLLSNHGDSFQLVYTDRFLPREVIGKTVIVHMNQDDYHTQPSGNAGDMIGCGKIAAFMGK